MKRALIFLAACLMAVQTISAQGVVPGISAGASLNNIDLKMEPDLETELSNINGVEAGLFLSFSAVGWYVKPMALASFLKGDITSSEDGSKGVESNFSLSTLETPLIVGFKLLPVFSIEAGPSWNYLIHYTDKVNGVNLDLSRHSIGYRAGVRANFSRLGIFGHYGGIIDEIDDSKYHLKRPSRVVFGVTFDLVSAN